MFNTYIFGKKVYIFRVFNSGYFLLQTMSCTILRRCAYGFSVTSSRQQRLLLNNKLISQAGRLRCQTTINTKNEHLELFNKTYKTDKMTNITPSIRAKLGKSLHNKRHHPISLLKQRIQDFFYRNYIGRTGNPIFAVFDNVSPVVTMQQNFDSLLVPEDHPSRHPKVTYSYHNTTVQHIHDLGVVLPLVMR